MPNTPYRSFRDPRGTSPRRRNTSALWWIVAALLVAGMGIQWTAGTDSDVMADGSRERHESELTAAGSQTPFRFAVLGDSGSGNANQRAVAERMCTRHRGTPFPMVITTGDNVYEHGEPEDFEAKFFRPYACLRSRGVKFHSSLGNHDFRTRRGWPEINEPRFGMPARNYVLRRSGVRFVVADSNELDRTWLARAIETQSGDRWTVVVFHHPVFSPGHHGSTPGMSPGLPTLFENKGVDLVLNGHDHLYSATKPLDKVRYVVTGGGGDYLYACSSKWFTAACVSRYHFLVVTAGEDLLRVEAVPARGEVFHTFTTSGRS